jgi:hypothetical protein
MLSINPEPVLDKYSMIDARLRLLAVHALIRRYRWEYNKLPNTLADLRADDLVIDPFTNSPLTYQRDGDRYTLYSQGPPKRDDNGQTVSNEHVPVKLIP